MSTRTRFFALALALFTLAGAACSGGGDNGGGGATPGGGERTADEGSGDSSDAKYDGCELVSAADAKEILLEDATVDAEANASGLEAASCVWEVQHEASFKLLQFQLYTSPQFYGGEAFKDEEGFESVDGLGDDAFFLDTMGIQLQVRDGDTVVILDATGFNIGGSSPLDKDTVKGQLVDLAARILAAV